MDIDEGSAPPPPPPRKPRKPRRYTLLERAVLVVGVAFLAFSLVTVTLYARLSDDKGGMTDVIKAARDMHRETARSVRTRLAGIWTGGGADDGDDISGGGATMDDIESLGPPPDHAARGNILVRPSLFRFGPLPKPRDDNLPPEGGVEVPHHKGRPDPGYLSSPPLKFKPPPPSKPKKKAEVTKEDSASLGVVMPSPGAPVPDRPPGMGGTAYANMVRGGGFYLDPERVDELRKMSLDIVLSKIHLEMRGRITCGGKPIMLYNDMDEVAELKGLDEVLPETDELGPKRLGRCAVVGNSGVLLDAKHGAAIDEYDTVIRFNAAPTVKFEENVGSKTSIRIQNVDHLGFREKTDKTLIFTARNPKDMKKFQTHRRKYMQRAQYVFNPEFWCHVWDWVAHRKLKPTSGMAGVVLAMHLCDGPVDIYGFHHNSTHFHYFNKLPPKVTTQEVYNYHPLWEEAALYKELEGLNLTRVIP